MLLSASLRLSAQDFKIYFANNVTDVVDFKDIESAASGLNWREVKNKEIAGNIVEVDAVKQMFASPDVKYKAQQRQFWRMRDHSLLCFRINDGTDGSNSYHVEVEDTIGRPKAITVSRYFFLNVMRQENPVSIRVWKTGDEANAINFKYYVADWDDDELYTFQLDSRRQLDNERYRLEYRVGYTDSTGEYRNETHQLELRDSAFQSFYVGKGRDLKDVLLMSGNHKLRLDKSRLHTGVTLDPDFERTVLSTRFILDKHEDRELVNFNWIGSGLYERYDTLYLNLFNDKGTIISKATINVDAVDESGTSIGDPSVKYLGYDRKRKTHMVLTHGNPAYLEIVAKGYCPMVYRYAGAAGRDGIVDLELCVANVKMFADNSANGNIAISSQHLYTLNDTKTVEVRQGRDYSVCDLADYDLSTNVKADTITYLEDAGNDWLKTLNGEPVSRYALLELAYSSKTSSANTGMTLTATDDNTGETYVGRWPQITTIYASNHPSFVYNHYFARYDLVGMIPANTMCSLHLEADGNTYDDFPFLRNLSIDRELIKKSADDYINKDILAANSQESVDTAYAEHGCSFNFPLDFKMDLGPYFKVKQSIVYDMKKQKLTSTTKLTYKRQDGPDEDESITEMRKEAKQFLDNSNESGHTWYEGTSGIKYSNVGDTRKFDQWFSDEMDDICSIDHNNIGLGFFGSAKLKFSLNLAKLFAEGKPSSAILLEELSGTIGYGLCLASPSLLDKYWTSGPVASLLKKIPFFGIGGVFEANVQGDFGVKTLNTKYPSSWDNFGFFFTLSGKIRAGLWAELCVPSNPIFAANLGLRGGGKIGIMGGFATPFQSNRFCAGLYAMAGMGIEAYANIRTFGFQWAGRAGVAHAAHFYYPDNGHNPFHEDYPYWLTGSKARTVGDAYRKVPKLSDSNFGHTLVDAVASDANPHFLDKDHVVYNDLADPADYNDDRIVLLNTTDNSREILSPEGTNSNRHMRSKRGNHEVVVYEQLSRAIDAGEMDPAHALSKMNELYARTRIMASVKQDDGTWKQYDISHDDGYVDTKPVVTIQDNGKAACIWQHGRLSSADAAEADTLYSTALDGKLVLSVFNGQEWSEPISLHDVSRDCIATEYDLIMRGDTVLVGTSLDTYPRDSLRHRRQLVYSSVDAHTRSLRQRTESITPIHFFMNRVGQHSVIALLYEKSDSTRDVYVKTLSMNGRADGLMGSDIGANFCSPNRVKIICDRSADRLNDFAILWTEMNNNALDEDGAQVYTEKPVVMLNASRISLQPSPFVTVPLTLGAERDSLLMMDFDGFLDDSHVKVVYSLADIATGGALIMANDKYFTNSFDYDIGYSSLALLGSATLPISIVVANTGTSAIRSVTATINDKQFVIDNSYVAPMQKRTFVVQYPLTPDFDGYISNSVTVDYNNAFRTSYHPMRKGLSFMRQTKCKDISHVDMENIELNLISHSIEDGVNNYVVELVDHSLYGLKEHNAIHVGLYPHASLLEPLSDEAEVTVTADDFMDFGGVRKAYATIQVAGVRDCLNAYLTTHVFDMNNPTDIATAHVANYHGSDNAHYVAVLPHDEPTVIRQMRSDDRRTAGRINIGRSTDGILVGGLQKGQFLRVFSSDGILVFSGKADSASLRVPLHRHDAYIVSTGSVIVKFAF